MAIDLLSYQGNADLGLGANADIAAPAPNANLDTINQTLSSLRNQNYEQNFKLFQQKINDRDTLREMLAKGITASGEIDNQDRPVYDKAEQETIDSFHNIKSLNDQSAIEDFYKKSTHLNDVVTHAQERNITLKALQAEKAKEVLPHKQKAYDDFIQSERGKPFEERINPYQQTFDFKVKPILDLYATSTKSYDSEDGLHHFDDTIGDYAQTLKNAKSNYFENSEVAEDMRQLLNNFQKQNPQQQAESLQALDAQIQKYNSETGNNVAPIKRQEIKDGEGKVVGYAIQEEIPDFAAKFALGNQSTYLTSAKKFNDKEANYLVNLKKAETDAFYKKAIAGATNKKANAYAANVAQQMKLREKGEEQDAFANDLWKRNITNQGGLIETKTKGMMGFKNIAANSSLPLFSIEGGSLVKLRPIDATFNKVTKTWEGGYYQPQYMLNGRNLGIKDMMSMYKKFKGDHIKDWTGSMDDYIKMAVDANKLKVVVKGANGVTDEDISRAALQLISNKNTKKGQEEVFTPPAEDAVSESQSNQSPE